jgi:hypothetical protein
MIKIIINNLNIKIMTCNADKYISDIVYVLKEKYDGNKNDDDYIKTFIDNNLNDKLYDEIIYNDLLNTSYSNVNDAIKSYKMSVFETIVFYKKNYNFNDLLELIDNYINDDIYERVFTTNKNESKFNAKLAYALILDDIKTNYNIVDDIIEKIKEKDDDYDDSE